MIAVRLIIQYSLVALLLTLVCGCTSVDVSDLSIQDIPEGGVSRSQDGLNVRAVPLEKPNEVRSRFGTDLLAKGVLPVFVEFDNHNPTDSFIISQKKCGLSIGQETAGKTAQQPRSLRGAEDTAIAGAVLVSPALLVAAAITATSAQTANHQFTVNQLQSKMLSPGGHEAGYVYFHVPDQARGNCNLVITAQKAGGGKSASFNIPLNLKLDQIK
jgi:hypothetical protein